jgi:hypothetical protein
MERQSAANTSFVAVGAADGNPMVLKSGTQFDMVFI